MTARRHPLFIAVTQGLLIGVAATAVAGDPIQPGPDFVVNSIADDGDGVCEAALGSCTLRDAIDAANGDPDLSVVSFDPAVFDGPVTLTLTQGDLVIDESITVSGPGANLLTIDAEFQSRHFHFVGGGTTNRLSGMRLIRGNGNAGTPDPGERGGAIRTVAALTLDVMILSNNQARAGGGLWSISSDVEISNSTLTGNRAGNRGGALYARGNELTLRNTTISGNRMNGPLNGLGSGIELNRASLNVLDSTVSDNEAPNSDGGASIAIVAGSADVRLERSIISAGGDLDLAGNGDFELDHALVQNPGEVNITLDNRSITGVDPLLAELNDNGGPTPTRALLFNSPAVDAGGTGCPALDQRGEPRPFDGNGTGAALCDIGAFEAQQINADFPEIIFSDRFEG